LSVAPERCLRPLIEGQGRSVISTDIAMARISMRSDVEALPVRAGAFGLIVCSDVLEHVVDDERALREITRVLAPDGIAVLHVPVVATETVEFGRAVDQDFGHRRTYGPDVIDRLRRAELAVETLDTRSLPKAQFKRAGLKPDVVYVASRSERSPSRLAVVDVLAMR
jgi:SAM-dependent methyltransferase